MGEWIGPDAPWPAHSKNFWDEPLAKAKAARWWVRKFDAHSWGKVVCRREPSDDRCELVIFSTGRGGESVAKELAKKVDRCPHRAASPPNLTAGQRAVIRAGEHLGKAERLILAVRRLREAGQAEERAQELLGYAVIHVELGESEALAEDALTEAGVHESEADQLRRLARGEMSDHEAELSETDLLDSAGAAVTSGSRALRRADPQRTEVRALASKVRTLREQIQELRDSTT